jgi:hypothetical protein
MFPVKPKPVAIFYKEVSVQVDQEPHLKGVARNDWDSIRTQITLDLMAKSGKLAKSPPGMSEDQMRRFAIQQVYIQGQIVELRRIMNLPGWASVKLTKLEESRKENEQKEDDSDEIEGNYDDFDPPKEDMYK